VTMDAYEQGGPRPVQRLDDVRRIDVWARDFAQRRTHAVESEI